MERGNKAGVSNEFYPMEKRGNKMTYEEFKAMIEALLAKLRGRYDFSLVAELGDVEEWTVNRAKHGAWYLRYWVGGALVHDKMYMHKDEMMPIMFELYPHEWVLMQRVVLEN
jgi:hypothetical protein